MRTVRGPRRVDLALIGLVAIVFFAPTIDNYWVKDDLLLGNFTDGVSSDLSPRMVRHYLWPTTMEREQFWRPVAMLVGFGDYLLWGTHPAGYHVGNVLLHALNAMLAALLLGRLTRFAHPAIPLCGGLAFALSAIHVESVAWVLQRMVLLSAAFGLLALLAWLRDAEADRPGPRPLGTLLFVLALLSKEVAIVLPGVFFVIDLGFAPGAFARRLMLALRRAVLPALVCGAFLGCRHLLWGRVDLLYGGMPPLEYARHNAVFENLAASLLHCAAPVNASLFASPWLALLRGAFLLVGTTALVRGLLVARRRPEFRRAAAVLFALGLLVFLPTLLAFRVREDLFNGRFFYLPGLALSGLVAIALWMPARPDAAGGRNRLALAASLLWFAVSAVTLAAHLRAWEDGARVIRRVQTAILDHAEARRDGAKEVVVVAFNVPVTRRGVPLIETHLDRALRPPLGRPGVRGVSLLDTLRRQSPASWPDEVERFREAEGLPWESFRYVFCEYDPPGITPAFPAPRPAEGAAPVLRAPVDGRMLRNTAAAPHFVFDATPGAVRYRLELVAEDGQRLSFGLSEGVNLVREGERPSFDLARGDPKRPEFDGVWARALGGDLPRPVCLLWWIEALDAEGGRLGTSGERRLVILDGRR